jgi:hypothetical protein
MLAREGSVRLRGVFSLLFPSFPFYFLLPSSSCLYETLELINRIQKKVWVQNIEKKEG